MRKTLLICLLTFLGIHVSVVAFAGMLNSPPVAEEDEGFTYQDNSVWGSVAENDYDPDGDVLTYSLLTGTPNGTITIYPDGTYFFQPNQYYFGISFITYQVCDPGGLCAQGLLVMYVPFLNDPPQANDDYLFVEMDEGRFLNVGTNDYEPDLEPMFFYRLAGPFNGTVTFNVNGTMFYIPNPGYTGTDMIIYQACDPCLVCDQATVFITVIPENEDPFAIPSTGNLVNEDTQLSGSLVPFVTDPENDPLVFSVQTQPANGQVVINANGNFVFTPAANFNGNTSFNYLACDIVGQCALGTYGITVVPVNDPPTTQNQSFVTNEDVPLTANLTATDVDNPTSSLIFTLTTSAQNGAIVFNPNGGFTYTPQLNWFGSEVLGFTVCDPLGLCASAQFTIQVNSVNDPPVPVPDFASGLEDLPVSGTVANDTDPEGDALTYSAAMQQANGTISMSANGSFIYYPNPNWFGVELITYTVCDVFGACAQGLLTITIEYVADQPSVENEEFTINEDSVLNGNVALNDSSNGEGELTYSIVTQPAFGTIAMNANGTFTYSPPANWFGVVTVSYLGCNSSNVCDSGILTITVLSINDPVLTSSGSASTPEDTALSGSLANLASDADGDVLTFTLATATSHGTINISSNGSFTYSPALNYNGIDQFTFTVCDPFGSCSTNTYTLTVLPVNDAPIAYEDETYTGEDNSIFWSVPAGFDADGDPLTYSVITTTMHGTLSMNANGTYFYSPNENFHGVDMFTYQVCDPSGACDAAVVVIYVFSINDHPVAVDDVNTIASGVLLTGSVALNDYDVDIEPLFFLTMDVAQYGTFVLNIDGTYTYISNLDFEGQEVFTYFVCDSCGDCATATLTITVVLNNTPPILSGNDNKTTNEDTAVAGNVATLASDNEGGVLTFSLVSPPGNGAVVFNANGTYVYTPSANYHGPDQFTFQVCDTGGLCATGTVNVNVLSVNDPPVVLSETFSLEEDQVFYGNVSLNDFDVDGDVITYSVITPPVYGTFNLSSNGEFMYHPAVNYHGQDVVVYRGCDSQGACVNATLTLIILSVNDAPVALDAEDYTDEEVTLQGSLAGYASDVDGQTLTFSVVTNASNGTFTLLSNGSYTYVPNLNFSGTDQITYRACDPMGACSQATLTIIVNFINDLPIAVNDAYTGLEDQIITGNVGDNDSDPDIEPLFFTVLFGTQNGTFVLNGSGAFVYTPNPNFFGLDQAIYLACDSCGACAAATVQFTIISVNDAPVANNDFFTMLQGASLSGSVAINDFDVDHTNLTYTLLSPVGQGQMSFNANGTFNFTPSPDFYGQLNLNYSVCDPLGACANAVLSISVTQVVTEENHSPVAQNDFYIMLQGGTLTGSVSTNDYDVDSDVLSFALQSSTSQGTITMSSNGSFVFTPLPSEFGTFYFTYRVCDEYAACAEATLIIQVDEDTTQPINNPPIALDTTALVCEGESRTINFLNLISDAEDASELLHVFVGLSANWSFIPELLKLEFSSEGLDPGTYQIPYMVCDEGIPSLCSEGIITIEILPTNVPTLNEIFVNQVSCFGQSNGSIQILSISGEGNISLNWESGGSSTSLTNLAAGNYFLHLTSDASCSVESLFMITVGGPQAALNASVVNYQNISATEGGSIQITAVGGTPPYTVQWQGPSGFFSTSFNIQGLTNAGQYTATVYDSKGCQTQLGLLIVGQEELSSDYQMSLYPNPTNGIFALSIQSGLSGKAQLDIVDTQGRKLHTQDIYISAGDHRETLDVSRFAAGVYFIQVSIAGKIETRIFVKE